MKATFSMTTEGPRMPGSKAVLCSLIGFLLSGLVSAQDVATAASDNGGEVVPTSQTIEHVDPDVLRVLMAEVFWQEPETEIEHAVADLVLAIAKNERAKLTRTESVLARHRWASIIAFALAHTLLLLGLYFGVREFRESSKLRRLGRKASELEMSVSLEGIAVKSSLNGFLLLLLSFAFYFAFLRYVYPLTAV